MIAPLATVVFVFIFVMSMPISHGQKTRIYEEKHFKRKKMGDKVVQETQLSWKLSGGSCNNYLIGVRSEAWNSNKPLQESHRNLELPPAFIFRLDRLVVVPYISRS
jgi:hypothetical protein